ncbi:hypothetical protein HK101_001268 [Irineochytrium annulatum]|nr:hypothetical protein HK101_001268 [Irineochytrium annulatum]
MVPLFLGRVVVSAVAAVALASSVDANSASLIVEAPSSNAVVALGDGVIVSWIYNERGSPAIDPAAVVHWTIEDLRDGQAFADVLRTTPITAAMTKVTIPADIADGAYSVTTTINSIRYSSPFFTVSASTSSSRSSKGPQHLLARRAPEGEDAPQPDPSAVAHEPPPSDPFILCMQTCRKPPFKRRFAGCQHACRQLQKAPANRMAVLSPSQPRKGPGDESTREWRATDAGRPSRKDGGDGAPMDPGAGGDDAPAGKDGTDGIPADGASGDTTPQPNDIPPQPSDVPPTPSAAPPKLSDPTSDPNWLRTLKCVSECRRHPIDLFGSFVRGRCELDCRRPKGPAWRQTDEGGDGAGAASSPQGKDGNDDTPTDGASGDDAPAGKGGDDDRPGDDPGRHHA